MLPGDAGLPKRVRSLRVLVVRAQGAADTTRALKLQVSCSSFFFTQIGQVEVVFLRTLRNAATCLGGVTYWCERGNTDQW